MQFTRLHAIVRGALALLAAGSVPAMHAAGYQGGTPTTVGVDGGTVRDLTAVALSLAAVFYPKITSIWKSLTNDPRIEALEKRLDKLEAAKTAKPAVKSED